MPAYGIQSQITEPADGETIDAVDVNVIASPVWDQHDFLDTLAALKAILVPTHGLVRYVRGYGHFVFVTSGTYSASTAASPWILTATDGTPGRWVMDLTAESNRQIVRSFACADGKPRGSTDITQTWDMSTSTTWAVSDSDSTGADAARSYQYFEYDQVKFRTVTTGSAIARHMAFQLNEYLVHNATLDSVRLILGGQGHGASLPLLMPSLGLARFDPMTSTWVSLKAAGVTVDTSASVAVYDAIHAINAVPDQNNLIDLENYVYYAVVCNEGHTNAFAELRLRQFRLTMTAKGFF